MSEMKLSLNEVRAMNKIAGTQMTKEQEIKFIKNRLQELEFRNQDSFDAYKRSHKLHPDTKVKIAGKETTAGKASKPKNILQKLGAKLFGKPQPSTEMPKLDPKNPINNLNIYDKNTGRRIKVSAVIQDPEKYKHLAPKIQSLIDTDPEGKEIMAKLQAKKEKDKKAAQNRKIWKAKELEKQKALEKWRKENPEKAAQMDKEKAEKEKRDADRRRRRRASGSGWDSDSGGSGYRFPTMTGGGFGGFGGGSFGGAGAGGSW